MQPHLSLSGLLALLVVLLAGAGEVLAQRHLGGPAGLVLLAAAAPLAVLAWLALGAPVSRRALPVRRRVDR